MPTRPRRPLVALVAVVLVAALVGGSVGGAVGVLRIFGPPDRATVPEVSSAFDVGDLRVADGWWLVSGGRRTNPGEATATFQVLADVTVTNLADGPRAGDFAVLFVADAVRGRSDGGVVAVATCRAGQLGAGETVTVDCDGPRQVVPTDFDRAEARLLD